MDRKSISVKAANNYNVTFWFHLVITILAWIGPFLFSWYLMVPAYLLVVLQFAIFKRCLLNARHNLSDENDTTFYSHIFELIGFHPNRAVLKLWIRRYVYLILSAFTLIWQLALGIKPLLF